MFQRLFFVVAFVVSFDVVAQDIFNRSSTMGGGIAGQSQQTQTQVNTGQDTCSALAQERRAIEYIDQKQIWVPIEQQNANYRRMLVLKAEMQSRGCRY